MEAKNPPPILSISFLLVNLLMVYCEILFCPEPVRSILMRDFLGENKINLKKVSLFPILSGN